MSDGYKYVDMFYHSDESISNLKVEINTTVVTGKVVYSTLFYSDENHTQYLGETTNQPIVLGNNVFQSGSLISGNTVMYAIGRIKSVVGSNLGISSLKVNDVNHIEQGVLRIDTPSLTFTTNALNLVYHSVQLGYIVDPQFTVELQVKQMVGHIHVEYLYFTDETYTTQTHCQTEPLLMGTNLFQVERVNKYVLLRFNMPDGSYLVISSFKINQVEQYTKDVSFTTPAYENEIGVVSETCFPSGTLVTTDQGIMAIQKLVPHHHTIQGKSVVAITSTYSSDKELVHLQKDSIRKNYPNRDTFISRKHKIYMKGKLKAAYRLVENYKGVTLVPYKGQMLYNVLLEDYGLMNIQGLMCETLHPINPMATLFRELYKKDRIKSKDYPSFRLHDSFEQSTMLEQ